MNTCKAILFDLDGVLCSTDRYHYLAWKALTERLGIPFDEGINDRLRGLSRMDSLEIVLERYDTVCTPEQKAALAAEKNKIYRALLKRLGPADLSDEVRSTLLELRRRGCRLAVGSSSKNAGFILRQLGLEGFFDAVADGTDVTRAKPDPEVFLCAAAKLGVGAAECAVVEDAKAGIRAAKAASMWALALGGDAAGCGLEDVDLRSFSDLLLYF